MLQPGLVSVTFRSLSPAEIIALVARAGLVGVEWGGDIHVPHGDVRRARVVRQQTGDAGLHVAAYGSYYRASLSEAAGPNFAQVLDTALELGAPVIRVWAGAGGSAGVDELGRRQVVEDLNRISELAARAEVGVAAEFHGGTLNDTNASTVQLLSEVPHPNFYSYWQPLLGLDEAACITGLNVIGSRLSHVHVYHWRDAQERRPLAEGAACWAEYLRVAAAPPGDRYAMLEFVEDDAPENFLRDAAVLKTWLVESP